MRLIDSRRWRTARLRHLARSPLCVRCLGVGRSTPATDVDHIRAHENDPVLFWDPTNWQSLCDSCHSKKTATTDKGFGNRKAWPKRPRRWVVCGPPASGKSTWVRERIRKGDIVWDLDRVADALVGPGLLPRPEYIVSLLIAIRQAVFTWLGRDVHASVYVIVTDKAAAEAAAIELGAELVELKVAEAELARRRSTRRADRTEWAWP